MRDMKEKEEVPLSILKKLMSELDDYEYDKRIKPKVMAIKIEKKEEMPAELMGLLGKGESEEEEMPELELPEMEEEDDELGKRFKKVMLKKA